MTREDYEAARAALLGNPPRHPKVGGEQPTSVEELDKIAARFGIFSVQTPAPVQEAQPATLPPVGLPDMESLAEAVITEFRTVALPELIEDIDRRFKESQASLVAALPKVIEHIDRGFAELRASLATLAASQVFPESSPGQVAKQADAPEAEKGDPTRPPIGPNAVPAVVPPQTPADPQGATGGGGDKPSIPENLGTLNYNQLRALAKDLGIAPVPNVQQALLDAIEQVRAAGAG